MPYVDLETSSGLFSFCYSIATPTSHTASEITPGLPCVLFLHSGYIAQEIFEFQFCDRNLREFNLISLDMRGYGKTKGQIGDARYTPLESASDVNQMIDKLGLPPCHIFGLSIGCTVALELVGIRPEKVLSLTLCSPISPEELEDVAAGRLEVHYLWHLMSDSLQNRDNQEAVYDLDISAEILAGSTQLLCNYRLLTTILHRKSVAKYAMGVSQRLWAGAPEKLDQVHKACIEWFLKRRAVPIEVLQKITGPVCVIHCDEDVAYSMQHAEQLVETLKRAGVKGISLHEVPGSHHGVVTNPASINRILYSNIRSYYPDMVDMTPPTAPTIGRERLLTPFTQMMMQGSEFDPREPDE